MGAEGLTVQDLAAMLAVQPTEIVKFLFMRGIMVQMNSTLDPDTVKAVGQVRALRNRYAVSRLGFQGRISRTFAGGVQRAGGHVLHCRELRCVKAVGQVRGVRVCCA